MAVIPLKPEEIVAAITALEVGNRVECKWHVNDNPGEVHLWHGYIKERFATHVIVKWDEHLVVIK